MPNGLALFAHNFCDEFRRCIFPALRRSEPRSYAGGRKYVRYD